MALAEKSRVKAISITDHDTIDGIKEILQNQLQTPEIITGVEISCEPPQEFKESGSLHILGYGFSVYDKTLNRTLEKLQQVALSGDNIFAELMHTVRVCSLGQITRALYRVGGRYRRSM